MLSRLRLLAVAGALCLAIAAGAAPSWAENDDGAPEGTMNAVVFGPVAPGIAVSVRALDNSDVNMALVSEFEAALAKRGYRVVADSPLVLTFETRSDVGAWSDSGRRSIIELEGHGGRMGGEDAKARVNLFNSSRGGLFNEGRGETNIVTQGRYRLEATLDDKTERKRLWQGWAESNLGRYQGAELLSAMVPVIAENLGKTVRRQPFQLP